MSGSGFERVNIIMSPDQFPWNLHLHRAQGVTYTVHFVSVFLRMPTILPLQFICGLFLKRHTYLYSSV